MCTREDAMIDASRTSSPSCGEKRVLFDFAIAFTNGGGLQGQRFRLDIDGDAIDDAALAAYVVRDLRLLLVESVAVFNKTIVEEAHKRRAP
jgi:arylformamidase